MRTRRGASLLELLIVLLVTAVVVAIAVPRAASGAARRGAQGAARDVVRLLAAARQMAGTGADGAAVHFDSARGEARLTVAGAVVRSLPLSSRHGVTLTATRDSLAYDARGLGHGAANLRVVLRRSAAAETVVVSRLGRVRGAGW